MARVNLPADAEFDRIDWQPLPTVQVNRSQWVPRRRVLDFDNGLFSVVGAIAVSTEGEVRAWRAAYAKLRGPANEFRLPATLCSQYSESVDAYVDGDHSAGASALDASGFPDDDDDFPAVGMYVTVNDQILLLTDVVATAGTGDRRLHFEMPLRVAAPDFTPIEVVDPYGIAALDPDSAKPEDDNGIWSWAFTAQEAAGDPFSAFDLALDFTSSRYRIGTIYSNDVSDLDGYAYSRTGAKAEVNIGAGLTSFATDVPAILSRIGYWARQALTNRVLRSKEFDHATWTKVGTAAAVAANGQGAPDGTATGDTFNEGTGGSEDRHLTQSISGMTALTVQCFSVFAKAGTGRYLQLCLAGEATNRANFDLQTGTIGSVTGGFTAEMIPFAAAGWYRCSIRGQIGAVTTGDVFIVVADSNTAARGDNVAGSSRTFHLWQAQQIEAAQVGPVIATTSAAATVAADELAHSIDTLADEDMLIWARVTPHSLLGTGLVAFDLSDGTLNNRITLYIDVGGAAAAGAVSSGVGVAVEVVSGALTVGQEATIIMRRLGGQWQPGKYVAGVLTWADATTAVMPTGIDEARYGANASAGNELRGIVEGAFLRRGTFSTDAAVIDALEAA